MWLLGGDVSNRLDAYAAACEDPEIVAALGLAPGTDTDPQGLRSL